MQPNPSPDLNPEPLLEVLDNAVPAEIHAAAWENCSGKHWYFGHGSNTGDWSRFWKLDLDGNATFDSLWEHLRPRCEALAGGPLRVIRQYANGHTYGLGGNPHVDDSRPGCFTLLYYPNPEWKDGWDGETMFHDRAGEIFFAVRPRPNRAVFFDSRILHAGRAPSRLCPALRVTVAFKLEIADTTPMPPPEAAAEKTAREPVEAREISRDGATRVYAVRVSSTVVDSAIEQQLAKLAKTVRIPGFRSGKIPQAVMEQRYGSQARVDILNRLGAEGTERLLPKGSMASSLELKSGATSGDLEFQVAVTYLPDLPSMDFSQFTFLRLTASEADLQAAGMTADAAVILFRNHLKSQVLDRLDAAYRIPMLPVLIERELSAIRRAAESQMDIPADPQAQASVIAEFRTIAERRLRLGMVVAEMARRFEIRSRLGAELEDLVIDHFVKQARIEERPATEEELRDLRPDS